MIRTFQRRSALVAALVLILTTAPSWADWAVVGASYRCDKDSFALHASIKSSGGTVPAPAGDRALKPGDNKLSCHVGQSTIQANIWLSGSGRNGECGSGGRIQIMKMLVDGRDVVPFGEPVLLYCSSTPTIVSIDIRRPSHAVTARICKGRWDWGDQFEDLDCIENVFPSSHIR